jgi:hypothetical protein
MLDAWYLKEEAQNIKLISKYKHIKLWLPYKILNHYIQKYTNKQQKTKIILVITLLNQNEKLLRTESKGISWA